MNCTLFAASFLGGSISLRWAQHKRCHKSATPITWPEFKAFFQKNLRSSQAFINSIWSKFRRDSQYQLEEVRDWTSHLQHLQSILSEFDRAPNELTMICYFQKGFKPSIKVEMEQQDQESINFEKIVQRAVNTKVKAGLRSSIMVWDLDVRCPRGHHPFHNTFSKMQTQGSKDSSYFEKPKLKDMKLAPSRNNVAKPAKKEDRKDKKKRLRNQRQKE